MVADGQSGLMMPAAGSSLAGWTTTAGVWIAALTLIGIAVRQLVPWKKQGSDAEAQFRDALIRRVENLEAKIERQEARHRAEQGLSNHKLRNMTACFDAMLLMLEMTPDRGPEIVTKIKQMRADQMKAEAREAAIIRAADMTNGESTEDEGS
jgi:hypothetical protein